MRQWTPIKFKRISMRMGYVPAKAWKPGEHLKFLDWGYLYRQLWQHRDEIYRKRRNQISLKIAVTRIARSK